MSSQREEAYRFYFEVQAQDQQEVDDQVEACSEG